MMCHLYSKGEYEGAIAGFIRAIESVAGNAESCYARGRDYAAMGDHPRAHTDLAIVREIDGGTGEG